MSTRPRAGVHMTKNIVDYGQQLQMAFSLHVVESVSEYYNF